MKPLSAAVPSDSDCSWPGLLLPAPVEWPIGDRCVSNHGWLSRMLGGLPPAGVGGFVTDVATAPPASAGGSRPASLATPRTLWPPERQKQRTKRARNAA